MPKLTQLIRNCFLTKLGETKSIPGFEISDQIDTLICDVKHENVAELQQIIAANANDPVIDATASHIVGQIRQCADDKFAALGKQSDNFGTAQALIVQRFDPRLRARAVLQKAAQAGEYLEGQVSQDVQNEKQRREIVKVL